MKKVLTILIFMVVVGIGVGAVFFFWNNHNEKPSGKNEQVDLAITVNADEMAIINKVTDAVFIGEKDNLKISDLTDQQKIGLTLSLMNVNYEETTGTEIKEAFHKYFGADQDLKLVDIICTVESAIHPTPESAVIYKYDKESDKYVFNQDHPGHGAYSDYYTYYMNTDGVTKTTSGTIIYEVKLLIDRHWYSADVTEPSGSAVYKTYQDAKDRKNPLEEFSDTGKGDPVSPQMLKKLFIEKRDELTTYSFKFKESNGNLIFVSYEKK